MARLSVLNGPDKRAKLTLTTAEAIIGRDADCDLVLDQDWISRHHCRLARDGQVWRVEDLGSRNGVYVNGVRVTGRVALSPADLIAIGPVILCFEDDRSGDDDGGEDPGMSGIAVSGTDRGRDPGIASGAAASEVRVAFPPDLRFAVVLAASLESQESITLGGKVTLRSLARRGTLAADGKFDGRLSGRFNRRQFLNLDSYDLTGRASYVLRAGLLLPRRSLRRRRQWAEAYVRYSVEYAVRIRRQVGTSVVDAVASQVEFGPGLQTVTAAEEGQDPGGTQVLVTGDGAPGGLAAYDVPQDVLLSRLAELAEGALAVEPETPTGPGGLTKALQSRCIEAAEFYRTWYRKQWQERATRHDSHLAVGELRYEFDAHGAPIDTPKAATVNSVYRWV